jgi:hypothetical protein
VPQRGGERVGEGGRDVDPGGRAQLAQVDALEVRRPVISFSSANARPSTGVRSGGSPRSQALIGGFMVRTATVPSGSRDPAGSGGSRPAAPGPRARQASPRQYTGLWRERWPGRAWLLTS